MDGLDILGAETSGKISPGRGLFALVVGAAAAYFLPKHRVLAFLGGAAVASNVHALAVKDRTLPNAFKRVGKHIVATASSLALPKHPAIGYVAGAIAADLFIDGQGGGIIEEWADYEGIRDSRPLETIIDAEYTEEKR